MDTCLKFTHLRWLSCFSYQKSWFCIWRTLKQLGKRGSLLHCELSAIRNLLAAMFCNSLRSHTLRIEKTYSSICHYCCLNINVILPIFTKPNLGLVVKIIDQRFSSKPKLWSHITTGAHFTDTILLPIRKDMMRLAANDWRLTWCRTRRSNHSSNLIFIIIITFNYLILKIK